MKPSLLGLATLACTLPAHLSGQAIVRISTDASIIPCPIASETIANIAAPNTRDRLTSADLNRVALSDDGRLWVSPISEPNIILEYQPGGRILERRIIHETGREGGVGRIDLMLAGRSDTLHVFAEGMHSRYAVGRRVSHTFLETFGLINSAALIGTDLYVVNAQMRNPERNGPAVHLLSDQQGFLRSVDESTPLLTVDIVAAGRSVTPSAGNRFWLAPQNRMEFSLWSSSGDHVKQVIRDAPWFEPWTTWVPPTVGTPPPRVWSISEDERGLLWIMVYIAEDPFQLMESPSGLTVWGATHPNYDTIIEVIDPVEGRLLAHCRFDALLGKFVKGRHVVQPALDDQGRQLLTVVRLGLPS